MKNLHLALLSFWNSFSWNGAPIPAFPSGRVPENQAFPYFTFDVQQGSFFSFGMPTAYIWCRQPTDLSYNAQAQRAEIMDAVAAAIPEGGKMLTFDGGAVLIRRNDTNFLTYYDPQEEGNIQSPTGEPVIGGRISLMVQYFVR